MKNSETYEIQEYLRALSAKDDRLPKIIPDGIYGEETREAVRLFQQAEGLPVTGTVNQETWDAMRAEYLQIMEDAAKSCPIFPFEENLAGGKVCSGDKTNLVFIVQIMLDTVGPAYLDMEEMAIDGVYGKATEDNVRLFQAKNRLPQTGEVDKVTWNRLAQVYNQNLNRE